MESVPTPSTSPESPPPHAGLLREETLVLRHLLGYDSCCCSPSPHPSIPNLGATLPNSRIKDIVFVAIDIDTDGNGYQQILPDQQLHIGISTLDTRCLQDLEQDAKHAEQAIKSYQFTIGESRSCRRAARRFLFGPSEPIALPELKPKLESLIQGRDAVLIHHGGHDLNILKNLGINCPQPPRILDTVKAAQFPLSLSYRYSLERLLETLDVPFADLHTAAGNDAHFVLRALLVIAVRDGERESHDCRMALLFNKLKSIAQAPRPVTVEEVEKPLREARQREKSETRKRGKAKRAAKIERRRLEREAREDAINDSPGNQEVVELDDSWDIMVQIPV